MTKATSETKPEDKNQIRRKIICDTFLAIKSLPPANNAKVAYAFTKNLRLLQPTVEAVEAAQKPSDAYIKYDMDRIKLCEKYVERDKDDAPVMKGADYAIQPAKKREFDTELEKLRATHKPAIDEHEVRRKDFAELIEGTEKVEYHRIKLSDIEKAYPTIEQRVMNAIYDIIEEED